jgi:DNA-binding NtrC family response regulator
MKGRALVIDDDTDLAQILGEFLRMLGWDPDVCSDAIEGSTMAVSGDYAVILCDKNMPKQNGMQIAAAVHSDAPETRVVLCTGELADAELLQAAANMGAEVVEKPLTFETLGTLLG